MRPILKRFYLALHPRPAYIIGSGAYGSRANLMAASWVTPVSEEPPRVAVAIDKESFTWELIKERGEFTVNVLSAERINEIYYVGSRSGRDVDKLSASGLKVARGEEVSSPVVLDSIAVLECRAFTSVDCGDTTLVIGDVVRCLVNEELFEERRGWDLRRVRIPLHVWGRAFTVPKGVSYAKGKPTG